MNTIVRLFYDLTIYRHIVADSIWKNLGRFLFAYLILTIGLALYLNARYVPDVINQTTTILTTLEQAIPEDAVISMNNYQLTTTNLSKPFIVAPYLYLDTTVSTSSLASASAIVIMNQTHLILTGPNNTHELNSYQQLGLTDFSLTGRDIKSNLVASITLLSRVKPYFPVILTIAMYLPIVILRLLHTLLYTLLFVLAIAVFKGDYGFGDMFKLTLHTIIVAEALNLAILIVYGTTYPAIFSIAFIGISILAYLNLPARRRLPPQTVA